MTFEIARRPTARRRESQFAAEPFADAGLRSPRVEGKAARSRSGLDRHDILAPFERVRQVEAHGGFAGADRLCRGKPANNQQQPSHPPPYANNSLTLAEISLPSARPASLFEATPITLPISFIDVAPTSAITALTSAASFLGSGLLGQEFLKYGHLRQLFGGQVRAVLLGEDRRGVGPLLGQLGDDLQHVGVGQFGDFRSRRLGFDDVFLGIAQCAQTHGILGLHGLHDPFRNLLFE